LNSFKGKIEHDLDHCRFYLIQLRKCQHLVWRTWIYYVTNL